MLPNVHRPDESRFWFRQMIEHAAFTAQALPSQEHTKCKTALGKLLAKPLFESEEKTVLLAGQLTAIFEEMLTAFAPPAWGGLLPTATLRHMIDEQNWYLKIVRAQYDGSEILYQATKNSREAAVRLAKALDPSEERLAERAMGLAQRLGSASVQNTFAFIATAADAQAEVRKFLEFLDGREVARAHKTMSSAMIEHEVREAKYFCELLRKLIAYATGAERPNP